MVGDLLLLKDKSVLYAEDDTVTRTQMTELLEMMFGKVFSAKDGEEAFSKYEEVSPSIIITDIRMPRLDGIKLVKRIRQSDYVTPIILVTSYTELDLLINAANLSVDGYLVKPVELNSIIETICKSMKRTQRDTGLIELGKELFYNAGTRELYNNGVAIALSTKEEELLTLLVKNRTQTVSKDDISKQLWPGEPTCDSAVKNLVLRIRRKLGFDLVISVRGLGYRLSTTTPLSLQNRTTPSPQEVAR